MRGKNGGSSSAIFVAATLRLVVTAGACSLPFPITAEPMRLTIDDLDRSADDSESAVRLSFVPDAPPKDPKALNDPKEFHQTLWNLWPDDPKMLADIEPSDAADPQKEINSIAENRTREIEPPDGFVVVYRNTTSVLLPEPIPSEIFASMPTSPPLWKKRLASQIVSRRSIKTRNGVRPYAVARAPASTSIAAEKAGAANAPLWPLPSALGFKPAATSP